MNRFNDRFPITSSNLLTFDFFHLNFDTFAIHINIGHHSRPIYKCTTVDQYTNRYLYVVQTGKSNDRYTATITLTTYERVQRSPAASTTTILIIVIRVLTVVVAVNHNISYGNDHGHRIEVPIDVYSIVGKMDIERVIINFLVVSIVTARFDFSVIILLLPLKVSLRVHAMNLALKVEMDRKIHNV